MKARRTPDAFALPIRTRQLAQGLIRLYQRLAGELEKAKDGEQLLLSEEEAKAGMRHAKALLELMYIDFDPRRVKPRRTRIQVGPLDYGGMKRGILRVLKKSGVWMTYAEIVDALIADHGLELTPGRRRHFQQKIREACSALKRTGLIAPELALGPGQEPRQQRWRLAHRFGN